VHMARVSAVSLRMMTKRAFDVAIAILTLIVLAPLMLVISIGVKLDSPGPVLYGSRRIGKRGRVFNCVKFRTKCNDMEYQSASMLRTIAGNGTLEVSTDSRMTKLGVLLRKYSLDGLPQFLNVLRGDMSIVGPLPPLAGETYDLCLSHLRRLDLKPGMTGLWQMQAREDPSFNSYISLDAEYAATSSIWLDLKIIARAIDTAFY